MAGWPSRSSGEAWLDGEDEGGVAMLVDTSERLGDGCGCGYGERRRRARSGVARERAEEGGRNTGESEGGPGGAWRREGGPGRRGSTQAGWRWLACGCARKARTSAYWREEGGDMRC